MRIPVFVFKVYKNPSFFSCALWFVQVYLILRVVELNKSIKKVLIISSLSGETLCNYEAENGKLELENPFCSI